MKPIFGVRKSEIYLDNAATTMIDPEVVAAMRPFLEENYGNPETLYHLGRQAKEAVDKAREQVAELMGVEADRVFFTSGGTESNNWVVKMRGGMLWAGKPAGIAISAIEHASVRIPAVWIQETLGAELFEIPVGVDGLLAQDKLTDTLVKNNVKLVCVQHANNEIGTVQDIKAIAKVAHDCGAVLHVDAVQSFGKVPVLPFDAGMDFVSVSAHKIHGPMGIGALYVSKDAKLVPMFHGGPQEGDMRAGTLPVHQIVGFGVAAEKARCTMKDELIRQVAILDRFYKELAGIVTVKRNANGEQHLPGIISIQFPGVEASFLSAILNKEFGVCLACGAACSRGKPSHVLKAIGMTDAENNSTLRISISRFTSEAHLRYLLSCIQAALRMTKEGSVT